MSLLQRYWQVLTQLGPGWVVFRICYALRRRFGALKRASPLRPWLSISGEGLVLWPEHGPVPAQVGSQCLVEAESILGGRFRLFSHHEIDAGFPPNWRLNQFTGEVAPAAQHWSQLADFAFGDIKAVWELSRFGWAFALVRAWRSTTDKRFADAFWRLFDDWCDRNAPNAGANWMCGQEASFRLMAVIFAAEHLPRTDEQGKLVARFVRATGERIAANLDYALSQKNNHGISECAGLITAALALSGSAGSGRWLSHGLNALRRQVSELVYPDGSFSQHSLIYHRLMLHDLCWTAARLRISGEDTPGWLDDAGRRAVDFLMAITNPASGFGPLFGPNDGAMILPLADGDYLDMRPTIQASAAIFHGNLPLPAGPWDESAAWLAGPLDRFPRVEWRLPPRRWHAPVGGYLQLVHGQDLLFLRCPTRFRHRPSQADMLHVDLMIDARVVAHDGGSFSYNSNERFTVLNQAAHHNMLTVDGAEPMRKLGRFLYLPWPLGTAGPSPDGEGWQVSHTGYARLGVHFTREVLHTPEGWRVVDRVRADRPRSLRWHWRLVDADWSLHKGECRSAVAVVRWAEVAGLKVQLIRAAKESAHGWWSPYYGAVKPAVALILDVTAAGDVELVMDFSRPNTAIGTTPTAFTHQD